MARRSGCGVHRSAVEVHETEVAVFLCGPRDHQAGRWRFSEARSFDKVARKSCLTDGLATWLFQSPKRSGNGAAPRHRVPRADGLCEKVSAALDVMTSQRKWGDRAYGSHKAFYEDCYGQHLVETHTVGRVATSLLVSEQSAGDWSDAPTPDLTITRLATAAVSITMDLGHGRVSGLMPSGSFVLTAPGCATSIEVGGAHRVEVIAIPYLRLIEMAGGVEESGLPPDGDFGRAPGVGALDSVINNLADRLWRLARSDGAHGSLAADGLILQIAAALLDLREAKSARPDRKELSARQVQRVSAYLDDRLGDDIDLAALASIADISPRQLTNSFTLATGFPPHRWLMRRRVERACGLLLDPRRSITEIAFDCGFSSSQHFATKFRAQLGCTPSEYRRNRSS